MKKYFYIFSFLLLYQFGYSQNNDSSRQQGYWTFGLNGGFSYQTSDVDATSDGFGIGATLAKNLYYQAGAPFAFDLRGRLLFARQYGLDGDPSFDISNNKVLNGRNSLDYVNYPNDLNIVPGFIYQNHRTDVGELALEAVIHFNNLYESTGIIANIYGGIGLDWYRTKIDQTDASGNEYYLDYANLSTSNNKSETKKLLESAILDNNYETLADDFTESGKIGIMPSLGFELGYAFTDNFYVFGGHRVTWSGDNTIDGQQWTDESNDLYHYTNFGLRWMVNANKRSSITPPVIEINYPFYTETDVDNFLQNITASISNVENPMNVSCQLNGRDNAFDFRNQRFETAVVLRQGRNDVLITASNEAGTDKKRVIFNYKEKDLPPTNGSRPVVLITDPSRNPTSTQQTNYNLTADISHIDNKRDIELYINNQQTFNFQFNPTTGILRTDIFLKEGRNIVRIRAKNRVGQDEASTIINLDSTIPLPIVDITDPSQESIETIRDQYLVKANIKNINHKSDISFSINGRDQRNFIFSAAREQFEANILLREGRNTISITATNRAGTSTDQVSIYYTKGNPPYVNITKPSAYSYETYQGSYRIEAQVNEIDTKNDIQFYVNGRRVYNFNFNRRTGIFTSNINLKLGRNDIRLKAFNTFGEAMDEVSITRKRKVAKQPPIVNIATPKNNSTSQDAMTNLRAQIKYVNTKNDIRLSVNGQRVYNFIFNAKEEKLEANINLKLGNNTIILRAMNRDGEDQQKIVVKRIAPQPKTPPVVDITKPNNNQTTSNSSLDLLATIKYVNRKNDIEILINGKNTYNFDFSPSQNRLSAKINLREGSNSIIVKAKNQYGNDEDMVKVTYQKSKPPTVTITTPINNSSNDTKNVSLTANTKNVSRKQDIQVYLNNKKINNFSFNSNQQKVTATLSLNTGKNTIKLNVKNTDGRDEDQVVVNYMPPKPPTVTITTPINNSTINKSEVTFSALTQNVQLKSEIKLYLNGKTISSFAFNQPKVSAKIKNLKKGKNTILIKVETTGGKNEATVVVNYKPPVALKKPVVQITNPSKDETVVYSRSYTIKASVENVLNKNEITIIHNKNSIKRFTLDTKKKQVSFVVDLTRGKNTIDILAKNKGGKASDETTLVLKINKEQKPVIEIESISQPVTNPIYPNIANVRVKANIKGVDKSQQIALFVNGKPEDFTFDPKSKKFEATVVLEKGDNQLLLTATNRKGTTEEGRTVEF